MKLTSTDGSGEYLENLRTFYLYQEAGLNRGSGNVPGSQAGVADMYSFNQDNHDWVPSDVWWWNARMQVPANMSAGAAALNTRWFNYYTSNLANITAWTSAQGAAARPAPACRRRCGSTATATTMTVRHRQRSCERTIAPSYNSQTLHHRRRGEPGHLAAVPDDRRHRRS